MLLHSRVYPCSDEAPWLALVHGAGGSSVVWFRQIRVLVRHFNLLVIDLRGHGRSETDLSQAYSLDVVTRDLIEVLDEKGIERAHWMGVSLGTVLLQHLAVVAPERIDRMVFAGAISKLRLWVRGLIVFGHVMRFLVPFIALYYFFAYIIMPGKRHREARQLFLADARKLPQAEFIRWYRLSGEIEDALVDWSARTFSVPVQFIMGEDDYVFLPGAAARVEPDEHASLVIIPDTGHVCNVEAPEAFNEAALAFLKTPLPVAKAGS